MSLSIHATGICPGIVTGRAKIIAHIPTEVPHFTVKDEMLSNEVTRYKSALHIAKQQLENISEHIPKNSPQDIYNFIESHLLILDDDNFTVEPIKIIREKKCNAEWALNRHKDNLLAIFKQMQDPYLKTRENDIDYLINKVLHILVNGDQQDVINTDKLPEKPHILFVNDLNPADLILLKAHGGRALITERGGPTSHTAILARSLNIPTIFGAAGVCQYINNNETVVVDGTHGIILANLSDVYQNYFQEKTKLFLKSQQLISNLGNTPTYTKNKSRTILNANIELTTDLSMEECQYADGIGLLRTEYIFLNNNSIPDETDQLHTYLSAISAMPNKYVTIRTLDLGSDNILKLSTQQKEKNPALGVRAIRLSLKDRQLFRTQIRAILRASALGKIRLLLPMINSHIEITRIKAIISEISQELHAQGFAFDSNIQIGAMIEIPAAALCIDYFIKEFDFVSIGTNDLIQYTLAVDRNNEMLNYLYNPKHLAVLKLINHVIECANNANKPVAVCGEMAGDPQFTKLLLCMGLKEFSVHPSNLLIIKKQIQETDVNISKKRELHEIMQISDLIDFNDAIEKFINLDESAAGRPD